MSYKSLGLTVLLVAFASSALAQTQISGALNCGKSDTEHTIEVGDYPGHLFIIGKGPCTWSTPLVIAGMKSTAYSGASATEVNGAKFQDRGYAVITMENGDKIYARSQDTGTATEGGKTSTYEGTWSFTGGTGKFKGTKGKGTYKGSGATDGAVTTQIEGECSLPQASSPSK